MVEQDLVPRVEIDEELDSPSFPYRLSLSPYSCKELLAEMGMRIEDIPKLTIAFKTELTSLFMPVYGVYSHDQRRCEIEVRQADSYQ